MQGNNTNTNITQRYDAALENARQLRTVAEKLASGSPIKTPSDVRPDQLLWQGDNGSYASVDVHQNGVGFGIYKEDGRPTFMLTAKSQDEVVKATEQFHTQLAHWQQNEAR